MFQFVAFKQRYKKASGEANEKRSFSGLTIPSRILSYGKIAPDFGWI